VKVRLDIVYPTNAGVTITNRADVSSTTTDPGPGTNTASDTDTVVSRVVGSTSTMTDSAFQLVDDLTPWTIGDFEVLVNAQNTIVATNPGQFYYHQRVVNTFTAPTSMSFTVTWPDKFTTQVAGGNPVHAYVELAGQTNKWTEVALGTCWNAATGCPNNQTARVTVNNVPVNATVWITVHLDYAPKGSAITTLNPNNPLTKPVTYGPFQSDVVIKDQATGFVVGTSTSSETLIGRGKKVTMAYGNIIDGNAQPVANTWIRLTQGSSFATALTDNFGFYLFYDGQLCDGDGLAGGCSGTLATWTFANGNAATTLKVLGTATLDGLGVPTSIPSAAAAADWPTGKTTAKVYSGSTTFATITTPTLPSYSITVSKGTAYPRDWKFTP